MQIGKLCQSCSNDGHDVILIFLMEKNIRKHASFKVSNCKLLLSNILFSPFDLTIFCCLFRNVAFLKSL